MTTSTSREYFESMYADSPDPWHFTTSAYEARKYALTVASLPRPRYTNAFEPGCSVGVLTKLLAPRCERLLASDIIPEALERARTNLDDHHHVRFERCAIPDAWPQGEFDLVVLSEVAYYFDEATLGRVLDLVIDSTMPQAHVVGVHWRGATDYPLTGDRTHELIDQCPALEPVVHHVEREFLLDVWERS